MRYPTLTRTKTEELVEALIAGTKPPIDSEAQWVGEGEDVDLGTLRTNIAELQSNYDEFAGDVERTAKLAEEFEGYASGPLHLALRELPPAVLDDPGFWRYLSLSELWWFIRDREATPIANGNVMKYVDGVHSTECVPLRMFLRAQAIRDGDDYSLAGSMKQATDFWRSHILRVQTGSAPPLARSFASLQSTVKMPTEPKLRPFARKVNRLWKNIVFHRLEEEEARAVLNELHDEFDSVEESEGES